MSVPQDLRFTRTHEWIRVEGDTATIGITDHAQTELGDITYLELPEAGAALEATKPFGVIESVKAASDIYAPVDGEVVERNGAVLDAPETVNSSPYDDAWLIKIKLDNLDQVNDLMDATTYETYEQESAV